MARGSGEETCMRLGLSENRFNSPTQCFKYLVKIVAMISRVLKSRMAALEATLTSRVAPRADPTL